MDHHALSLYVSKWLIFLLFFALLIFTTTTTTNAAVFTATDFSLTTITFEEGYSSLFSNFNIHRSVDDKSVRLLLNRHSGSGIISSYYYNYGYFSAKIKLPSNYTAGIVVAFYMSNVDTFDKNHDELDFEFLGNIKGKPWRIQTNMYGNGSLQRGREERYRLWFDPSKEFHRYSILWTPYKILYFIDQIPIREVVKIDEMGGDFPSKPMSVYATIWDASTWATNGGQNKVDYRFEPFASEFTDLILEGCPIDPIEQISAIDCNNKTSEVAVAKYANIRPEQRSAMKWFREKYMYYTHCYDLLRYSLPMPECVVVPSEQALFKESGRLKEAQKAKFHRRRKRRSRNRLSRQQRDDSGSATMQVM